MEKKLCPYCKQPTKKGFCSIACELKDKLSTEIWLDGVAAEEDDECTD